MQKTKTPSAAAKKPAQRKLAIPSTGRSRKTTSKNEALFSSGNQVWLTVCRTQASDRDRTGWWCLPRAAQAGDWLVFYQVGAGLVRVERATTDPFLREPRCGDAGLLTIETEAVASISNPIPFSVMKADPKLSEMQAIRRSFQGTAFKVADEFLPRLKEVIAAAGLAPL